MKTTAKTTVTMDFAAHKRARIAAGIVGEDMGEFLSKAADERSEPILRKHRVKLPADAALVSQAA